MLSSSESLFFALPLRLQRLVDEAFDLTADRSQTEYDNVKAKSSSDTIPQQLNEIGAGGFLVESHESHSNTRTSIEDDILDRQNNQRPSNISLSSIPSALQLLDLPPDDQEVLSVFKNAASGWTSCSITSLEGLDPQEKYISREDWRSVCAVLLEHRNEISSDDERSPRMSNSGKYVGLNSESYNEMESGSDSAGSSSDEYTEHHAGRRTRVQNQKGQFTSRSARPLLHLDSQKLSSTQKEACLKTFALFFPEVPHHKLADHRIMIKDLQRVSKLLGEKIKAEEMVEMLSTFSTSPDKSVSFEDFTGIMIAAKLA